MIKELELFIQKNNQPIYLQVAKAIRNAILNEQLKNGELLPSSRMLSAKLKIGRLTVMNALEELHAEGLIESKLRKHYFVTFEPELNKNIMRNNDETITVYEIKNQNETLSSQKSHLKYDMRSGVPELDLIPRKEIKKIYSHLIDNDHKDLFDYTTKTQGDLSFLNEISNYFRRKRFLLNKHYMTTNGSQEAIYLIAHHLLKKGDYVAMEEKTYQSAFDIFKKMNIKIIPIQTSPLSGINIKHFQKMIEQYPIKLIYLTPSHQYPTTFSMTYPQKIQIYQSCLSKKIKIIEDDYDFEDDYDIEGGNCVKTKKEK